METSNCDVSWEVVYEDTCKVRVGKPNGNWIQEFLMLSDIHFDSPHCDRKLLKILLDEAKERGAPVFIWGDWFDAMGSRDDPRRSKDDLMDEYNVETYLDALVNSSYKFLEPYKDNIVSISDGNHDTVIRKKLETDLVGRLARELDIIHYGYSSFVLFLFSNKDSGSHKSRKVLFHHHGLNNGGIVTKGTMRAQRESSWVDADVFVGEHTHESWRISQERLRINNSGKPIITDMLSISVSSLKREFNMRRGFHVERGRGPKPIGGAYLRFRHNPRKYDKIGVDCLIAD